jgi:4'-phosphopantetheinyl transferase
MPLSRPETRPAADSVELVLVDLSRTDGRRAAYETLLSPEEKARADRFRFEPGRESFIATRGQLRLRLGDFLGIAPEQVRFETSPHGKPRLLGAPENRGLVFNVSHSGGFALLAFSRDTELGVDIEAPRRIQRLDELARACLTVEELIPWRANPEERRLLEFLRLWTCKEAFFKATGRGIALGLESVAVAEDLRSFAKLPAEYGPRDRWRLHAWQEGDHPAALAYSGEPRTLSIIRIPET